MIKPPAKTEAISALQIQAISDELKRLSQTLAGVADTARKQPESYLAIYNWPSCEVGLQKLQAFANDAHKSKTLADIGKPREVGQLKPRSTARERNDAKIKRGMDRAKKKIAELREQDKKKKEQQ